MGLIDDANREAYERLDASNPALTDVVFAKDVLPDIDKYTVSHAGPPITWERMSGPMRSAVMGALVYEGLAETREEAAEVAASGKIKFRPNHDCGCVGPMAGVTTYSMPLCEVTNLTYGNKAYIAFNESDIRALCFGSADPVVIPRLHWFEEVLGPAVKDALAEMGPINLKAIVTKALTQGEELHNRIAAGSVLFFREIAPTLVRTVGDRAQLQEIVDFLAPSDYSFLNLGMAYGKASADAIKNIPYCTVVTAMSRNGTDFGIKVSALGDRWFTAPCPKVKGIYFPGYSEADANPDLGDSAITETVGLGGCSMAANPAMVHLFGAESTDVAQDITREMLEITVGASKDKVIPNMNNQGIPLGIDIRKVVETEICPLINTGIAHKDPSHGQIGAGVSRAPLSCFQQALEAFAESLG
ncbi:MAG: DUF1116 domain-containing protein [Atopobiaceae bacterium]|nr:DUF1116 domain-containing protein [Atopobiaceae bacterium]MDO5107531.1 DUF1116 domain-containing protein [Coriobacteriaceae bacterium]